MTCDTVPPPRRRAACCECGGRGEGGAGRASAGASADWINTLTGLGAVSLHSRTLSRERGAGDRGTHGLLEVYGERYYGNLTSIQVSLICLVETRNEMEILKSIYFLTSE